MFKEFIWKIFYDKDKEFVLNHIDLDEQLASAFETIDELNLALLQLQTEIDEYEQAIDKLVQNIAEFNKADELEEYWNEKRPQTTWTHRGRPNPTDTTQTVSVDPRIFYQNDHLLPTFSGTNDQIALLCLNNVHSKIRYTSDEKEYWQFAYETYRRGKGDCEDGAILMANMMLLSGIPYWRVRLNAGDVKGGGHAYVTYLREEDNTWYILDWCYWYDESKGFGRNWKDAEKYFGIWGSWNTKYMYGEKPE